MENVFIVMRLWRSDRQELDEEVVGAYNTLQLAREAVINDDKYEITIASYTWGAPDYAPYEFFIYKIQLDVKMEDGLYLMSVPIEE